jgi:beta-mannosidase
MTSPLRALALVSPALRKARVAPAVLVACGACALSVLGVGCGAPSHETPPAAVQTLSSPPGSTAPSSPRVAIDLAGGWRYLPYNGEGDMGATVIDDSKWPSMSLPSNWFLLGGKEYPPQATAVPPSFGDNAPGELWPINPRAGLDYSGTVWFRREVELPAGAHGPFILDLDMVDYYAEVFVNGTPVGHHEGYFQRWSVDATRALRPGKNVVAVKVSAPALDFDMAQQYPVSWPKMQNQIKGIFAYHDTRPGATSWRGQERSTGGILRGVALRESSGVELSEVTVTPLDVGAASARLVVDATVHNWTQKEQPVDLDGQIRGATFEDPHPIGVHVTVNAPPGVSHARVETTVDHPHLWWLRDYGKPDLYTIDATLGHAGAALDHKSARFGIRSIRLDDKWTFWLNGERIYPRGTNYIATQWLSQADRAFYARDLKAMIDANLNAVRVHAHIERPEFYDLADELGIMVWQDFPLQWGYTDMPAFRVEALRQAEDMITQYGDHPSVLVWCMHNESPHAMAWMKHRDPDQNLALDDALAALAHKLDPSRVVHRDSGTGDGHYYYGWYDGTLGDVATSKIVPLVTEYGASALPPVETLRTMFDAESLWPDTPKDWETWQFADFQPKSEFGLAKVSQGRDIDEFVRNTQRYQAINVRYTTEVFRRRKWSAKDPSTGIFQFMFSDDWPSITWSVVDYYRRPKQAYAALKESMQRLLPSIEYTPTDPKKPIALYAVNDFTKAFTGAKMKWTITQPGKPDVLGVQAIDIPADGVVSVAQLGSTAAGALSDLRGKLDVTIVSASGEPLAHATLSHDDFL